jgi:hypothetical protein
MKGCSYSKDCWHSSGFWRISPSPTISLIKSVKGFKDLSMRLIEKPEVLKDL